MTPSEIFNGASSGTSKMALQGSVRTGADRLRDAAGALTERVFRRRRAVAVRAREADLRYRTLFECVSDGFALVEVIPDAAGHVQDYLVLEANPALLRMMNWNQSPVGKRQSEALANMPTGWLRACDTAMQGRPVTLEHHSRRTGRWFEIHFSRITNRQLAQLIVDITERKQAEQRGAEMFDELNHRVKNNLAIVSSMLAMQARSTTAPEVREQLTIAVDRIQTVADIHATLYRTGRKDEVDFAAYLNGLCDRLGASLLDPARVTLTLDAAPTTLPLDRAVALGVLVNELVTNAAKHAYPAPDSGRISVRLEHDDETLALTVEDGGQGFPAEPQDTGLGMRLIRSLVEQLGATFEIKHNPGATILVRMPDEAKCEASGC